ncbi:2-hydroxyacid dehydrogenase [Terriglobus aquaticus]|uniref:2-hydroxyacid dehydrogenase n=1 Tax=Terriglobus aquaticus TaxID=940139 RepID=A0ABW9KIH5_9BACT|nr:phosphoglycerate dehydrogenase [Terriglobus aquaticus]
MIQSASASRILVISDSLHTLPEAVAILRDSGSDITWVHALTPWHELSPEHKAALHDADAVVMGRVMGIDAAALTLAPRLRVIALHTSGSDNVDLEAASARGILVTNVKGVNAEQCAEFAMGLMLDVVRQIRRGDRAIRAGLWAAQTQTSMDVVGSTIGVIGLGQIAQAFVVRARAFGARILVHTRTHDESLASRLGFEYASLDDVLRNSDIVNLFAALTPETRHMIGARELALMKPSAYLINIARGELIDETALFQALQEQRIAGAGLDVFETEPLFDSPLFALDNVTLTPHQAGLTIGGKTGAAVRAATNALEVLRGSVPKDTINATSVVHRST